MALGKLFITYFKISLFLHPYLSLTSSFSKIFLSKNNKPLYHHALSHILQRTLVYHDNPNPRLKILLNIIVRNFPHFFTSALSHHLLGIMYRLGSTQALISALPILHIFSCTDDNSFLLAHISIALSNAAIVE